MPSGYNQYIGMRYVPIVDGAWSATKSYEPLVVVTYNGNSYISKTFVPTGTIPTNEEYWILSANYNAQVEQYRQEVREYQQIVENFDTDISDIEGNVSALQTRVDDHDDDITTLENAVNELTYGFLIIGHINLDFNAGVMDIDTTTNYTTSTWTLSSQTSAGANLRRLYPNGQFYFYPTGFFSGYGNIGTAVATVTETGSIEAGTWALTVTCNGSVHNNSGGRHTVNGYVNGILEFKE